MLSVEVSCAQTEKSGKFDLVQNMKRIGCISVLIVTLAIIARILADQSPPNQPPQCQGSLEWAKKVADPLSDFTVLLYRAISVANREKNIVFSPVSVSLALALLKAGADGPTRYQMRYALVKRGANESDANNIYQALERQMLVADMDPPPEVHISVVNALYLAENVAIKPAYLALARECFSTRVEKCDFRTQMSACRQSINRWVSTKTSNKIAELFREDSISAETSAVLANAIYFKAPWHETFPARLMSTSEFYRFGREAEENSNEEEQVEVEYMTNEDQYPYTSTSNVAIVGIPYKEHDFYMYIVLPKKRDGLDEFEKTFTGTELMFLINRTTLRQVEVTIPKFRVEMRVDLKPILISLGLNDMFKETANFSRMTESNAYLNAAAHEAFIEVNENGTESAAATGQAVRPMSARPIPIPFVADHPFMYAIVHQPTHAIVVAGKILYI